MGNGATESGRESTTQERVQRWWPVVVSLAAVMVLPLVGIPMALVLSTVRRWDRPVMLTLLGIATAGALLLSLVMGAGGDGFGTGS